MVSGGWEGGGLGCFGLGVCASQLALIRACQISHASFPPLAPLQVALALRGSALWLAHRFGILPCPTWHRTLGRRFGLKQNMA